MDESLTHMTHVGFAAACQGVEPRGVKYKYEHVFKSIVIRGPHGFSH